MDDENDALMQKDPSQPSMGQDDNKDVDNGSSNYCNSYCKNIAAIILVILTLFILIIFEIYHVYAIGHNMYFDDFYLYVYLALFGLIVIVLVSVTLILFMPRDTQK